MVMLEHLQDFINGCTMTASLVIALFFARFYRDCRDRFFLLFASAFFLLAIERIALQIFASAVLESHSSVYLIRCLAFIIIIYAVVDKNRH